MLFNYYFQGFLKQTVFRSFQTVIIYEYQFKINHNLKDQIEKKTPKMIQLKGKKKIDFFF